jgi:hypothetical protein
MRFVFIIACLSLMVPQWASAYIPRTKTIEEKMSRNNGRKHYKIVREVTLESRDKQIRAREVWSVAHGDRMKLEVTSLDSNNPWSFAILYSAKDRKTLSRKKAVKSFKKSPDFFEPLFHDRSSRSLLRRLIGHKFIPGWLEQSAEPTYEEGKTVITPEPFVSLAAMEGSVNYALGAASNSEGGNAQTQLWVEQDSFLIKKGRLRSQAEFVNTDFQSYPGGLTLPSEQQITWGDRVAKIKVLQAESTRIGKNSWTLDSSSAEELPSDPLVKEFYSRFR